jgi:DNA-directed RNA polymerase subunit RPC12/RpoP
MVLPALEMSEAILLRARAFNKLSLGSGVRLLKCESCGRLTDSGFVIDRDILEPGPSGRLEKTGYERWILCPECGGKIMARVNDFSDALIEDIENSKTV